MRAALLALLLWPTAALAAPWESSAVKDWTQPPAPGAEPAFHAPPAQHFTLANGMKVVVVENHRLPLVSLRLVVRGAGSAADPAGQSGLSAFTADMLDEGAGGKSALEISEQLDRLGARLSISDGEDAAFVDVSTLKKTLEPTIDLVSQVVGAPALDGKEVARVHGDRMVALKQRRDRPREVAGMVFMGALFGARTPYGHPRSGTIAEMDKLGEAEVRAFYSRHWRPSAMTLVVAGDVDVKSLQARLGQTLGAWKGQPAALADPRLAATRPPAQLYLVDRPGAPQAEVRVGLVWPRRTDPRFFKLEVLRAVLGDGFTSRLNHRLREELGYTYGAGALASHLRGADALVMSSALVTEHAVDGVKELMAIVDDLAKKPVPADELEKTKRYLVRQLPQEFESNDGIARAYATLALFGLPDDWYDRYAALVSKVSARDVQAMAREQLALKTLTYTVVGNLAAVRPGLEALGLGKPVLLDLDGEPVR